MTKRKSDNYNLRDRKKNKFIIESESESESESGEEEGEVIDITSILADILGGFKQGDDLEDVNKKYLDSLTNEERKKLKDIEEKIKEINLTPIPLRYKVLGSNLEEKSKALLMQRVIYFEKLESHQGEYFKLKKYMDGILNIPFKKFKGLKISEITKNKELSFPEKVVEIRSFIEKLKEDLDYGTYGQQDTKNTIIEIVATWISNPLSSGNIIGLCGPPGCGKTSIIKNGLSKALDMPFAFIPLGGSMSASSLEGSDYTYEGSKWGRIVDILMEQKCMNPIIFFDELDKIPEDKLGDEINSLLIHLTDSTQNNSFRDKYFNGIDFDLSKCLMIFSFNDANKLNSVLKDRINIVHLKGFDVNEKIIIAKDYCLKDICDNVGLSSNLIEITDETLKSIIIKYCPEKGVRKLKQCLNSLVMKINLFHITRDFSNLNLKNKSNFKVPYTITPDIAISLLDPVYKKEVDVSVHMMYT